MFDIRSEKGGLFVTDCASRVILGIDPGLANTGWGIVRQTGGRLACLAYGCISTSPNTDLSQRLRKIYDQMALIVQRYEPNLSLIHI